MLFGNEDGSNPLVAKGVVAVLVNLVESVVAVVATAGVVMEVCAVQVGEGG